MIDDVEVKRVGELSPRDIEHDNPEFRRLDETVNFLEQIYGREVSTEDLVTVIRFSQIAESARSPLRQRRDALPQLDRPRSARAWPLRFLTTWLLTPRGSRCSDAIFDQERWPELVAGGRGGGGAPARRRGSGVGTVSRLVWRSRLPYRIEFEVTTRRVERPHLMEGHAVGELTGTGRWRLFEQGGVTAVVYEWNVATTKAWMNAARRRSRVPSSSGTTTG